ncbi:MAG: AzlC family ABC transporter permease [Hyphomicrobiales bacterium]|nr:AzlC family ABC transporter permease [Hyphomicrobiales bacterium]
MREEAGFWREMRFGMLAIFPICVAALPIGLVWGALAAERGLSNVEIGLMSATVFAGASQFVAIGLWASPLPVIAIIFATFMINLRHVMMSVSLGRSMQTFTPAQRLLAFYCLTDEVWALSEARALKAPLTPAYYAGMAIPLFLCWFSSTMAGGVFGSLLGRPEAYGLDFVFSAMFIGLIVGFRNAPAWLPVIVTSAAVSTLGYQLLPAPWFVIAGGLAGVCVAALISPHAKTSTAEA